MNIQLASDLENSIQAIVQSGRFASVDEAMAAAAQLLLDSLDRPPPPSFPDHPADADLGFIGALREDADLLDRAVEYAMNVREERAWRVPLDE